MLTIRHNLWLGGILISFLFFGIESFAQTTFTWTGATNNNWNVSTNWTKSGGTSTSTWPNQNAGQNDQVIINSGSPLVNGVFTNTSLTSVAVASRNRPVP
jgi:hypothetical protein